MVDPSPPEAARELTLPDRVRTPLLTLITAEAIDQDYRVAARNRAESEREPGGATRARWAVAAVAAIFALLVTLAAVQTSRNAADSDASRAALIDRIETRRDRVQQMQAQAEDLRASNAEDEQSLIDLGDALSTVEARQVRLATATGFGSAVGPGIQITVDNPEDYDPDNRLRDSDLALLVDGLWDVGAEAVAINGQRITVATGIRNSGTPVEVNGVGIAPPYRIEAIGDIDTLAADLVLSDAGQDFLALAGQFGYRYQIDNLAEVRLPAAPSRLSRLRSATDSSLQEPPREGRTP